MRMNHVNLSSSSVAETAEFLQRHFGFTRALDKGADRFASLRDDAGNHVNLSNFDNAEHVEYPRMFHVGFFVDGRDEVDAKNAELRRAGYDVQKPREDHGCYTFYVRAPGEILVEVAVVEQESSNPT